MPHSNPCLRRWLVVLFLLTAVLVAGCGKPKPARSPRVPVTVATAERRTVPLELAAVGTVEPLSSATVHAQVGGIVTAIRFREGEEVRAGQTLFELDRDSFEAMYARARGTLARQVRLHAIGNRPGAAEDCRAPVCCYPCFPLS